MVINKEFGIDTNYKIKTRVLQIYIEKEEDAAILANPNVIFGKYLLLPYRDVSAYRQFNEEELWRLLDWYDKNKCYYFIPVNKDYNYFYTSKDTYDYFKNFETEGRAKGWFKK